MTQQHVVHAPLRQGELTGYIHSTESGAGVDGPGMRFVYFMSGCQFRCQYCHNPDTWKLHAGRQLTVEQAVAEVAPLCDTSSRPHVHGGAGDLRQPAVRGQ